MQFWEPGGPVSRLSDWALSAHRLNASKVALVVRYYCIGLINTVFGYGLFATFIFMGLNLYVAQLVAHVTGTVFNYFTYSRHVFRDSDRKPIAYVSSYALSYFLGLGLLATAHHYVNSPYLAGFLALLSGTAINFFVLKRFVFPTRRQPV
jgi:putative flippase GtrA